MTFWRIINLNEDNSASLWSLTVNDIDCGIPLTKNPKALWKCKCVLDIEEEMAQFWWVWILSKLQSKPLHTHNSTSAVSRWLPVFEPSKLSILQDRFTEPNEFGQWLSEARNDQLNNSNSLRKVRVDFNLTNNQVMLSITSLILQEYVEKVYTIKCVCSSLKDDGSTVFCEECTTWQHIKCYYSVQRVPAIHYCTECEQSLLYIKSRTTQLSSE